MTRISRAIAGVSYLAFLALPFYSQSPATPPAAPAFLAADVHVSPYRRTPELRASIAGDHYTLRDATMLNLITIANGGDPKYILGGPTWLEWDRFDVFAKVPPGTAGEKLREMLHNTLVDRFKLVTHAGTQSLPAYLLTAGKGRPKLKKAATSDNAGCQPRPQPPTPGTIPWVVVSCNNVTMDAFAQFLRRFSAAHLTSAVVDSTGLKGSWDFDLRFTEKKNLAAAGADGISVFDAIDKQLGLQLALGTAPIPVVIVDSVNEKPMPNPAGTEKILPSGPPAEFDVAVIKASKPDTDMDGDISGGQVSLKGTTLKFLITFAWDLPNNGSMLAGAPKWLDQDHFDILAKATREANAPQLDEDDLRPMMRTLLADRFRLATHSEDQPTDAYNLVAINPKLQEADPTTRASCRQGPGPDGKDPRVTTPILNRLLTCQGITMTEFAEQIQTLASGYIKTPVLDATGIEGTYDLTLSYSGANKLRGGGSSPEDLSSATSSAAADPSGAVSFFDALNKTLGLKLAKVKRPVPVLVIDHIEEKPTEN